MARKVIGSIWDRLNRNGMNENFEELYNLITVAQGAQKSLEDFLNGTGVVSTKMLQDKLITTSKLNDLSVSTDKLGTKSVTREKIDDGAVNNVQLANSAVTYAKLAEGIVDLTKISDEFNLYLKQKSSDVIDVEFELGGWNTGGDKVTTSTPKNVRSKVPIYLRKGMKLTQTPNAFYQYELIERSTNIVGDGFYVGRTGMKTFGVDLEITNNNFYYLFVKRTDDATMTADDVVTVNARFNDIKMDYSSLVGIDRTALELGGWNTGGNKVTSSSPVNIRSASPILLNKGESFKPLYSSEYMYEFIIKASNIPSDTDYLDRTGKISFGKSYVADRTAYYYLVVYNNEGRTMKKEDLDRVDGLINSESVVDREYIINILSEYGLTQKEVFALGGWWTGGNRTASDQPINVSPTTKIKINPGEVLDFEQSNEYEYELFIDVDGEFDRRTGYRPFGNEFISKGTYDIALNVRRVDMETMTNEDVAKVSRLYKGVAHSKAEDNFEVISKFSLVGDLNYYESPDLDYFSNPNTMTAQDVNNMFISLANDNNDIVSYKKIGEDAYSNNLYAFEIKPHKMLKSPSWNTVPTSSSGETLNIPKIIITSGIHGREKNANYAVYYFMKHLLENRTNTTLTNLLMNVHFVIIPMINPSGYASVTYENKAGVNLNRDFPPHGDATQPETKAVKAVIDQHRDADYHIDFHNHTAHDTVIGYSLTDDESMARITTNAYKLIGRQWQIKQPELPQDRTYQWGYTSGANVGTVGRYTQSELGIPSSIIETAVSNPWVNEVDNGRVITQIGVDLLANVLIGLLKARG